MTCNKCKAPCQEGRSERFKKIYAATWKVAERRGEGIMFCIMAGLLAISLGLWGLSAWWWSVVELLRGVLPLALIFFGVLALAAGVMEINKGRKHKNDEISAAEDE
ncbi:hypothetical protein CCP2SC5_210010 [Azospirillaceae bacterium]